MYQRKIVVLSLYQGKQALEKPIDQAYVKPKVHTIFDLILLNISLPLILLRALENSVLQLGTFQYQPFPYARF